MDITTKNMRALLINVLLGVAIVAVVFATIGGGWSLAKYTGILPLKKAKKSLVIDKTPITVENVKAIGELVTATWYDEMVIIVQKVMEKDANNKSVEKVQRVTEEVVEENNNKNNNKKQNNNKNELVIIQKAHGRIGINMANLTPNDLVFSQDRKSVRITLPALECLDFIINPTDTEVFSEAGDWNLDNLKEAMQPAKDEMKIKMQNDTNLFKAAGKGAQEVVTQLFKAAGYENVQVGFASNGIKNLVIPSVEQ